MQRDSSVSATPNWPEYRLAHQVCCGLIWARDEGTAGGQGHRAARKRGGRVENRLFQISVREVISMLAGRRANEESSVLRLQSSFPIASCGVVAWRWLDELSTLSVQNVDGHVGGGSWVTTACTPLVTNHTHTHTHRQTLKASKGKNLI